MASSHWNSDPLIGKQLANFLIQKVIGRGGMATVYKGEDVVLGRSVAIKIIHQFYRDNPVYVRRMHRESQLIATWRHPNIVQVYYADFDQDVPYFVMEYVDGPDLRNILDDCQAESTLLPVADVLRIGDKLAAALDFAHSQGVIHRDVKPSNVLLAHKGNILLTDFGLALEMTKGTLGESFGTPHYMSPEQAQKASDANHLSDLYSLAVILFEMLTGHLPFEAESVTGALLKTLTGELPEATTFNNRLAAEINEIFARALSRNPEERYSSGRELIEVIRTALGVSAEDIETSLELLVAEREQAQASGSLNEPCEEDVSKTLANRLALKKLKIEKLDDLIQDSTQHDRLNRTPTLLDIPTVVPTPAENKHLPSQMLPILLVLSIVIGAGLLWLTYFGLQQVVATPSENPGSKMAEVGEPPVPTILPIVVNTISSDAPALLVTEVPTIEPTTTATAVVQEVVPTVETAVEPTPILPTATRISNPDLMVIYPDPLVLYLYNPTEVEIDVALLSFVSLDNSGKETSWAYRAQKWGRTIIEPQKCNALETGTVDRTSLRDPRCTDFNWIDFPGYESTSRFWVTRLEADVTSFGVYWGGELVRVCEIGAKVCRITLDGF